MTDPHHTYPSDVGCAGIAGALARDRWIAQLAARYTPLSTVRPGTAGVPARGRAGRAQDTGSVGIGTDSSELRRVKADLTHQALHDALTGLPNRRLLQARVQELLQSGAKNPPRAAILLLDLNQFKEVNGALGHQNGDLLLQQIAARLVRLVGPCTLAARLGGDEFAIVLPGAGRSEAVAAAQCIVDSFEETFLVDGHPLHLWAAVGIALCPAHATDSDGLLRHADVAMYAAKRSGEPLAVYAPEQDTCSLDRLILIGDLHQAITAGQLALHYQPQVETVGGRLCGVEALARWHHVRQGRIPPDEFIPLAEQTGLIGPLTRWVLQQALHDCSEWRRLGRRIPVSVNVAPSTLLDSRLVETIGELLTTYDLPPEALRLEVTESTLMIDPVRARDVLTQLAALGVYSSVDDFGAGYSSLGYLKRLPVNELKIDKSFVLGLAEDTADTAIVAATIDLGHRLGLRVVAEGVEDQESRQRLAAMGCDVLQGYWISRPLPVTELVRFFADWPIAPTSPADGPAALSDSRFLFGEM